MCRSVIAIDIVVMHVWMSISWVLKCSLAKAGEPTGELRRRKPVTAATIITTGVSTAVDAASGLIAVFPAAASVSGAIAVSSSLAVHA